MIGGMSSRPALGDLHRAILTAAMTLTVGVFVVDAGIEVFTGTGDVWSRAPFYLLLVALEAWQRRRPHPDVTWVLVLVAVLVGSTTLVGMAAGGATPAPDPVTATAVIFTLGVITAVVAPRERVGLVSAFYVGLFAPWMAAVAVFDRESPGAVIMRSVAGTILLTFGSWLVWRLRSRLEDLVAEEERHARQQKAVAGVSEALMSVSLLDPLGSAARAVREGFEADDVAIVRLSGPTVGVHTAVGTEAVEWDRPPMEVVHGLSRRMPVAGPAGHWPAGVYLPVTVAGSAVGLLAVVGGGELAPSELALLGAVAEMVGSFWERVDAQNRLEELVRSKDELVAAVSHELRTPLTAVLGLAVELSQRWPSLAAAEISEFTTIISEQSRDMADIVEDLLVAARADLGTLSIRPDKVDLRAEVDSVISTGSVRVRSGGLGVDGEAVYAWADPLRCRQVIRNLVTNALRYGGDQVRVQVKADGGRAVVEVADDGQGLAGDEGARVFEPYYRARQAPTQPGSVGLGLAVSRQLARLMGGDVRYLRRDGWTVFSLELPGAATSA